MGMFISVIVPIFNVESYLSQCIDSVLSQDYDDFELILVNDGSTDGSLDIARSYLSDERVILVCKPNGGLSSARNAGVELIRNTRLRTLISGKSHSHPSTAKRNGVAHGSRARAGWPHVQESKFDLSDVNAYFVVDSNVIYCDLADFNDVFLQDLPFDQAIHFLDSDDYLEPQCLRRCDEAFRKRDPTDIVWHVHNVLDDAGRISLVNGFLADYGPYYSMGSSLALRVDIISLWWAWRGAFRAGILNVYKLRFAQSVEFEDNDFGCILFFLSRGVALETWPGVTYRVRQGSITRRFSDVPKRELPSYLMDISDHFANYGELKAYFKYYSYLMVALNICRFVSWRGNSIRKCEKLWFAISACYFVTLADSVYTLKGADPKFSNKIRLGIYSSRLGLRIFVLVVQRRLSCFVRNSPKFSAFFTRLSSMILFRFLQRVVQKVRFINKQRYIRSIDEF